MSLRTSAHTCGNPRPRRGTWQVGSTSGKFVALFRICLRHCSLVCAAARRTDCRVASLLAMTGENLLRVRVCQEVLPESVLAPAETHLFSACHCVLASAETSQSSACHCEPVRTLVWQSVSPQRNLASLLLLGQIRMRFFVFARSTIFCYALPQGDADCHVASLLAMTGKNLLRVHVCQEVLPESVLAPADTPLSSACLQCKDARPGANLRRALPSACRNWAGQPESGHGYPGDMPPGSPDYRRKAGKPYGKHRRYVETD